MLMVIEILKSMRHPKHNKFKELLRDNMIFFVPLVNIDSYVYINENWRNPFNSERILMIRKNRHLTNSCDALSGGVDLNRNYSFKFAMDDEGSSPDPCQEDYRGEFPFSEPEIASLKNYIDHHP